MNTQNEIALVILGNPISAGGMQTLAVLGRYPSEEFKNLDSQPLIKEGISYMIRHANDQITYTIKNINVRPSDSGRDGSLIISIAIPKTRRLKANKSPYSLLMDIYNRFVKDYMIANNDGTLVFKVQDIDKSAFEEILQEYEVEGQRGQIYVPMQNTGGVGVVCAPTEEKMLELFRDSQYPEFREYSHVEIGRTCHPTVNIDIPRKKEYVVYINNRQFKTVVNGEDIIDSSSFLKDEDEYHTYQEAHIRFTLQDLMESENGELLGGLVKLRGLEIICTILPKPKDFSFSTDIVPRGQSWEEEDNAKVKYLLKEKSIKVKFGANDITENFITREKIEVKGDDAKKNLSVEPRDYGDYEFDGKKDLNEQMLILQIAKKFRKREAIPSVGRRMPTTGNNSSSTNNNILTVEITIDQKGDEKYDAILYKKKSSYDDRNHFYLRQPLNFQLSNKKYTAIFNVDSIWTNNTFLKIEKFSQDKTECFEIEQQLYFVSNPAKISIHACDFRLISHPSKWKKGLTRKCVIAVFFFLLGLGLGYGLCFKVNEAKIKSQEEIQVEDKAGYETNTGKPDVESSIAKDDSLTHEETSPDNPEDLEHVDEPVTPVTPPATPDYLDQIVKAANKRDWAKMEESVKKAYRANQIDQPQKTAIEHFWWGNEKRLTPSQIAKRDKALGGKQFRTIEDLVNFYNEEIKPILD